MTALLENAVSKINALSPEDQDALASLILEEIASEKHWDHLFSSSQDQLASAALHAIEEYKSGKTKPLDPDLDL